MKIKQKVLLILVLLMEEVCLQLSPEGNHVLDHSNFTRDSVPIVGSMYANVRWPYDLVLVVVTLRMKGTDDERSGFSGVYTVKSSKRYFGNAVVNEVWHIESILSAILLDMGNQCNILRREVICSVLGIFSVILTAAFWTFSSFLLDILMILTGCCYNSQPWENYRTQLPLRHLW